MYLYITGPVSWVGTAEARLILHRLNLYYWDGDCCQLGIEAARLLSQAQVRNAGYDEEAAPSEVADDRARNTGGNDCSPCVGPVLLVLAQCLLAQVLH